MSGTHTIEHTVNIRMVTADGSELIDTQPTLASAIRCILQGGFEGTAQENAAPFMIFDGDRFEATVWLVNQHTEYSGIYRVAYRDGRVQSFDVSYVVDENDRYLHTDIQMIVD